MKKYDVRVPVQQVLWGKDGCPILMDDEKSIAVCADSLKLSDGSLVFFKGEFLGKNLIASFAPGGWLRVIESEER